MASVLKNLLAQKNKEKKPLEKLSDLSDSDDGGDDEQEIAK